METPAAASLLLGAMNGHPLLVESTIETKVIWQIDVAL